MANTIPVTSLVLGGIVDVFEEESITARSCKIDLSSKFISNNGRTISGKKPSKPQVFTDMDLTDEDLSMVEDTYSATLQSATAAIDLDALERAHDISEADFKAEVKECARVIIDSIDQTLFSTMGQYGHRVERADYTAGLSFQDAALMNAALGSMRAPVKGRMACMGSYDHAYLADNLKSLQNPNPNISDIVEIGGIAKNIAGFDWYSHESVDSLAIGSTPVATAAVNDTVAEGDTTITMDTTDEAEGTITAGQAFTIAGVYRIDPRNQAATNELYTFIAAADATASSNAVTVTITEAIYTTATNRTKANVSALPADDAAVAFIESGAAGKSGKLVHAWHPGAMVCAFAEQHKPKSGQVVESITMNGITLRLISDWDTKANTGITRVDAVYAIGTAYKELVSGTLGYCQ